MVLKVMVAKRLTATTSGRRVVLYDMGDNQAAAPRFTLHKFSLRKITFSGCTTAAKQH